MRFACDNRIRLVKSLTSRIMHSGRVHKERVAAEIARRWLGY